MNATSKLPYWDGSMPAAIQLQREIAQRVEREDRLDDVRFIAGVDVSANRFTNVARAAIVVLSFPDLQEIEIARAELPITMDYMPGLLSFREAPVIFRAMDRLRHTPDLLMVDGQGIAHPRRCGIACHLGVLLDIPSIGCAKSILRGKHDPLPDVVGARADLMLGSEVIGLALRTRVHANPLYISIGNRVSLPTAISYVERCLQGTYRLPTPTRLAHNHAAEPIAPEASGSDQPSLWGTNQT